MRADCYGQGALDPGPPFERIAVMICTKDLYARPDHAAIADPDRRAVKYNAAAVDKNVIAQMDVDPVGTVKRRFDQAIFPRRGKERTQRGTQSSPFDRGQVVMGVHGLTGGNAQAFQLIVEAGIPITRRHYVALCRHDPLSSSRIRSPGRTVPPVMIRQLRPERCSSRSQTDFFVIMSI